MTCQALLKGEYRLQREVDDTSKVEEFNHFILEEIGRVIGLPSDASSMIFHLLPTGFRFHGYNRDVLAKSKV